MAITLEQLAAISEKSKREREQDRERREAQRRENRLAQERRSKLAQETKNRLEQKAAAAAKKERKGEGQREKEKTAFFLWWTNGLDIPEISKEIGRREVGTQRFIQAYVKRRLVAGADLGCLKSHYFCFYPHHAQRENLSTKERDPQIFEAWKNGERVQDIAERYGISCNRCWDVLRRYKDAGFKGYRRITKEKWAAIVGEYNQGLSTHYLSLKYKIHMTTINTALSKHLKSQVAPRYLRMRRREENILQMLKDGAPLDNICSAFLIRPEYVNKIRFEMECQAHREAKKEQEMGGDQK